ncbi:MAG: hypothetical protein ABI740_10970, partial [Alphaproteobacteria bacterium]
MFGKSKNKSDDGASAGKPTHAVPGIASAMPRDSQPMAGLMQDWQLTVDKVLEHARSAHGQREIVTR